MSPKALDVEASRNIKLAQKVSVDDVVDPERESEFAETRRESPLKKKSEPECGPDQNKTQSGQINDIENSS